MSFINISNEVNTKLPIYTRTIYSLAVWIFFDEKKIAKFTIKDARKHHILIFLVVALFFLVSRLEQYSFYVSD